MMSEIKLPQIKELTPELKDIYLAETERCGQFKKEDVSDTDLVGSHFSFESSSQGEEFWFKVWNDLTGNLVLDCESDTVLVVGPNTTFPAISKDNIIKDINKMVLFKDGDLKEVIFDISEAKIEINDSGKTLTINLK
jgi:hypothetical protein